MTRIAEYSLVLAILVTLATALVHQAGALGITVDEPSHLLSAQLYWHGADNLKPRDMPPLIKIVGGWVSLFFHLPDMTQHPSWRQQHEWPISSAMLQTMKGPDIQPYIFASRLPFILFPMLTTSLLWWWSRQLFSPSTALTLAALFAFEPTSLGHGAFFKNDHAATFGYLLFGVLSWRYWLGPSPGRAAALGAAACVGLLAKLSLLILPPLGLAVLLLRRPTGLLKHAALFLGTIYLGALVACQFDPRLRLLWDGTVAILDSSASPNPVWLHGRVIEGGTRTYFLQALSHKLPLTLLFFLVCSLGYLLYRVALRRLRFFEGRPAIVISLLALLIYLTAASFNSIQFGIRLILPIWPYLMVLGGLLLTAIPAAIRPAFQAIVLAGVLVASYGIYPRGSAYFNGFTRNQTQAINQLADSNIDWGQDLPSLARFMEREQVGHLRLAYFGNDLPSRWLPSGAHELVAMPWQADFVRATVLKPEPGLYAISANCLSGQFFPKPYRTYFSRFRRMKPYANAGSFFIYLIDGPKAP